MIASFRHKGLRRFYEFSVANGIQPSHANRLKVLLSVLNAAQQLKDIDKPGLRLHPLTGTQPQRWSIHVSANWRLTFAFENGDVRMIDYEDYH